MLNAHAAGRWKEQSKTVLSRSQLPVWRTSAPFPQASCMWTQPNPRLGIYLGKHPIFILLYLRLKRIPTPPLHMPCDHTLKRPETGAHTYWLTRGYSGHSLTTPQHLTIMRALFHTCALAPSHAHTWGGRHTFTHFRHSPRSLTLVLLTRYTRSPCSTVPSALSFNPSGCWTYTVRRKQREAKISPRALSPWTLQLASFVVSNPRATSHTKHCRYVCWDTGELNALFNLVYCQFPALSNLSLQEVLRTMCPFLRGISRRPLQAPVLSKYSLSKLKERDAGPEYQEGGGIPRHACRTLLCPRQITPRHSLVFYPQGSESPPRDSACKHTSHPSYLQETESIGASLCPEMSLSLRSRLLKPALVELWQPNHCPVCGLPGSREFILGSCLAISDHREDPSPIPPNVVLCSTIT